MFQLARRFTDKFRIESEIDKPLPCWCETTPDVNKCSSPENNSSHMCNFRYLKITLQFVITQFLTNLDWCEKYVQETSNTILTMTRYLLILYLTLG